MLEVIAPTDPRARSICFRNNQNEDLSSNDGDEKTGIPIDDARRKWRNQQLHHKLQIEAAIRMCNDSTETAKHTSLWNLSSKFKLPLSSWSSSQRSTDSLADFDACTQSWTSSAFTAKSSMSVSENRQILSCSLEKRCRRSLTCGIGGNIHRWKTSWTVISHLPAPSTSSLRSCSGSLLSHTALELYDSAKACRAAHPPRRRLILNPVLRARRECALDGRRRACFSVAVAGQEDRLFLAAADHAAAYVAITRINAALAANLPTVTPWPSRVGACDGPAANSALPSPSSAAKEPLAALSADNVLTAAGRNSAAAATAPPARGGEPPSSDPRIPVCGRTCVRWQI
jgi:hypothetical protein